MSEAVGDLEAEARSALEAALADRDEDPADLDKLQLYVYADDLPEGLDDDRAISLAAEVLANAPETVKAEKAGDSGWLEADFSSSKPGYSRQNTPNTTAG